MSSLGPQHAALPLENVRVAVLGYGAPGREHALALRNAGGRVTVGVRLCGMSWVRARKDGFLAEGASVAASGADVVVVLVPDDEQPGLYFHAIESHVPPGALLVFGRGVPLATGAFEPKDVDAVFVAGDRTHCRVGVHRDATGRALERAAAYARAVFGAQTRVGTTTVEAEAAAEIDAMAERAGGFGSLLAEVDRAFARACETHAPDEAKVAFYDGLRELIRAHGGGASERRSATSLMGHHR